jgi:hypothetical protein
MRQKEQLELMNIGHQASRRKKTRSPSTKKVSLQLPAIGIFQQSELPQST